MYEANGKEVTPADTKEKAADGDGAAANGAVAEAGVNSLEESLKEPGRTFNCYSCGIDCTRVRYHNSKSAPHSVQGKTAAMAKYDLCPSCFMEGRFPANTNAVDYTKLENERHTAMPDKDALWTDAETLLLLEGLELFDDDWNSVADHVGSRTREECVLRFLQLEIEDKYLEAEPNPQQPDGPVSGAASLAYLSNGGRIPFNQADNPVLSVMGFLAGLADPNVTAAAAGKSVEELRRSLREKLESGKMSSADADASNKGKEKETRGETADQTEAAAQQPESTTDVKNEDTMDLDHPAAGSPQPTADNALTTTTAAAAQPQQQQQERSPSNPLATIPLALSATRAAALASHEERALTSLVSAATNVQLQKLALKLQQFGELEALLAAERRDVERRKQQLFLDRLAFQKRVRGVEAAFERACSVGRVEDGLRVVREAVGVWGVGGGVERGGVGAGEGRGEVRPLGVGEEGYRSLEV